VEENEGAEIISADEHVAKVRKKLGREPTVLEAFGFIPGVGPVVDVDDDAEPKHSPPPRPC
jgi:hypothetical protein